MATDNQFGFDPNMTLAEYFQQMQGGMPQPTGYTPDNAAFEQLMGQWGNWNPSATAPNFTPSTPTEPPAFGNNEAGTSWGPSPSWGPFSQIGIPTNGGDPSSWDFWAQDSKKLEPLQAWANFMQPWLGQLQSGYQYQQDFDESQRRYDQDSEWSRYADQFSMDLNARQQQAYELAQQMQNQQWLSEFGRTTENDQFSQQMALQNLLLNQARLAQQQEAARYQAFGRASAPARFVSSWG